MAIKRYSYLNSGAPTLTARSGSLISLLDAVLKDGLNAENLVSLTVEDGEATQEVVGVTSTAHGFSVGDTIAIAGCTNDVAAITLTSLTVGASNVVTAVTPADHNLYTDDVVTIAGCDNTDQDYTVLNGDRTVVTAVDRRTFTFTSPSPLTAHAVETAPITATPKGQNYTVLNGDQVITEISDLGSTQTHFTFVSTSTLDAHTASGTITAENSALGFGKPYSDSGTKVAVYRAPEGKRDFLRVDDSQDTFTLAMGFTGITSYNTADGTAPYPAVGEVAVSAIAIASNVATATCATHTFRAGDYVILSGCTNAGIDYTSLNTHHRILSVPNTTHFTFSTSGFANGNVTLSSAKAGFSGVQWNKGLVSDGSSVSVTSLVVLNDIAVATTATAHGYASKQFVTITGATPSGLNGSKKITVTAANKFTFATTESNQTATGTITALKNASRKWYFFGDTKGFRLFAELKDGVYQIYEFGDTASFRGSSANSLISGIVNNSVVAFCADGGSSARSLVVSAKNTLVPTGVISSIANRKTSGSVKPTIKPSDSLREISVFSGVNKIATLRGLYASELPSGISHQSGTSSTNKLFGAPSDTLISFQTVLGNPAFASNLFVQASGDWS